MSDRDLEAPWVGICEEDYYGEKYCEKCGNQLDKEDDFYDDCICEECQAKVEEDEEK